jgi:signal transduction histidine kinase
MHDVDTTDTEQTADSRNAREIARRRRTIPRLEPLVPVGPPLAPAVPASVRALPEGVIRLDLREIAEQVVGLLRMAGRAECMQIDVTIPAQEATVWMDRREVEQVLFNVVRHAIDGVAKAAPAMPRVSVQVTHIADLATTVCRVTNNVVLPTSNPPVPRVGTGTTDLGLVVAKRLVEAAGGSLTLDPGQGAAITVALPSRRPSASAGPG